jgi:23S rRNA (adenine2503-C2)-methyltransferase
MSFPSVHDPAAIEAARKRAGLEPEALRPWRHAFYRQGRSFADSLGTLPAVAREPFAGSLESQFLELAERIPSDRDRASRLLFRTRDGHPVEAVLMQADSGRSSLCISSQVGCPCACSFCATGGLGFVRNLTADEMLDQVLQASRLGTPVPRNVVFMGMGEPLLNCVALHQALVALLSPRLFGLGERRVMVSTCGIPEPMLELAKAFPGIGLALSLHAARPVVREALMPIARHHSLPDLRAALTAIGTFIKRDIMLEILLLDGINDGPEDAAALAEFAAGLPVYVNLLTYNPIPSRPDLRPAGSASYRLFTEQLEAAGHKVTRRYSHGADIAAACGQLAASHRIPEPQP